MKSSIALTASARRQAEQKGVLGRIERLHLEAWTARGDLVEVPATDGAVTFVVCSRRIRVAPDGALTLVLELDHPARRPG